MSAADRPVRDTAAIALWAQRLLYAYAAASALWAVYLWSRLGAMPTDVEAAFGVLDFALFLATAVAVLRWLYLAAANARRIGAQDMMGSPGWTVGWFFVPFANLVMPLLMVRELWKASARPRDWQAEPVPATTGLWWAAWLGSGITGAISLRLNLMADPAVWAAADGFAVVSAICAIPSALLLAHIIAGIEALQARAAPEAVFA